MIDDGVGVNISSELTPGSHGARSVANVQKADPIDLLASRSPYTRHGVDRAAIMSLGCPYALRWYSKIGNLKVHQ